MSFERANQAWDFGNGQRVLTAGQPALRFRVELPLGDGNSRSDDPRRTVSRLIEVPGDYTFWDLHVAIQSAMGWLDCHLHEFEIPAKGRKQALKIGFATVEMPDVADGRWIDVQTHLRRIRDGNGMLYCYDFGDNWRHWITYEATVSSDGGLYPRCLAGRWACPPEDCGGDVGYFAMLDVIADRAHPDCKETREWLHGAVSLRGQWPYRPERFDPRKVKFDDPEVRAEYVFGRNSY